MKAPRCNLCGRFRKASECVEIAGDSDDCGNYETWIECRDCMSPSDEERYFKKEYEKAGGE